MHAEPTPQGHCPGKKELGYLSSNAHQSLTESYFWQEGGEGVCFNFLILWPPVHGQRRWEGCPEKSRLRAYGRGQLAGGHCSGKKHPWCLGLTWTECLLCARHITLGSTGHHVYGTHVARGWFPPALTPTLCVPPGCCPSQSTCCTSWDWRRRRSVCMPCPGSFSPCSSSSSVCCCSS